MYILGDIGGTKMRIARSRDLETFDEPIIIRTPEKYDEGLKDFIDTVKQLAGNEPVEGVATGAPMAFSRDRRTFLHASNLPDWNGHSFADDLEAVLGAKVFLENDTAVVGLGEVTHGAGKGPQIVVYITVSTGVNGVRIVNGLIDPSVYGFEIGSQFIYAKSNEPQALEALVSGRAIHNRFGKPPRELGLDAPLWEELAETLAYGMHNTILHWCPDRIVLGGSMFNEIGIAVDRVKFHVEKLNNKYPTVPEMVHSALGDLGGLHGAMALLKQKR